MIKVIGASASASVCPMNIQGWFPSGLTGLISLQSKGLSRVFSSTTIRRHQFFGIQPSLWSNSHIYTWILEKSQPTFVSKVMSLLFNMLSRLVIALLPRSKHLLISQLQSPTAVILEPKKIKSLIVSIVSPSQIMNCSILDWKIPWTEEPGRLQSLGLQRIGHDWVHSTMRTLPRFHCLTFKSSAFYL